MAIGSNDFITRNYAEKMISNNTANLRNQVKDIQEQINQWNIDFAGLNARIKRLENNDPNIEKRLDDLICALKETGALTHVTQGVGETLISLRPNDGIDGKLIQFEVFRDTLPEAITALVINCLEYLLVGQQD